MSSFSLNYKTIAISLNIVIYYLFILLYIESHHINGVSAAPSARPFPDPDLRDSSKRLITTDTIKVANLSRRHGGDVFYSDDTDKCDTDTCVGMSSGTAGLFVDGNVKEIDMSLKSSKSNCKCQCLSHLNTYREDLGICVDDIRECTLAPFVSSTTSEKIPFVFLPLRGQIIYPSKEISFPGVKQPMCAVSGSQYLTKMGWSELRNPIDTDVPFRLFRDEGRMFLQWLGEADLRIKMQGRLILVHLMCRDMTPPPPPPTTTPSPTVTALYSDLLREKRTTDDLVPNQNIFTPCVAFRVVGTPIKHVNNVTEVTFSSETQTDDNTQHGMTTVIIAVCSLCLGLIYIASVFLYIHVKKRKTSNARENVKEDFNYPQNDQVTFGAGISRNNAFSGQARSSLIGRNAINGSQRQPGRNMNSTLNVNLHSDEMGVIKSNPLLKHYPNLHDSSGFTSDTSNSMSEFENIEDTDNEKNKPNNNHTSAVVHPSVLSMMSKNQFDRSNFLQDPMISSSQEQECIPEENVSIIEEMNNEEKMENMKSVVNGSMRRKLYFNPAYFEPQLLESPPPAAIEFLNKIREVISIAKYKMAAKKYHPSLIVIPEEIPTGGSETYIRVTAPVSRRSSFISSRLDSSKKSACSGCPGCETKTSAEVTVPSSNCKNCGDKQNSIRKWLEDISVNSDETPPDSDRNFIYDKFKSDKSDGSKSVDENSSLKSEVNKVKPPVVRTSSMNSDTSASGSDNDTIKANSIRGNVFKVRANSISSTKSDSRTAPKIVSHSLKSSSSQNSLDKESLYGSKTNIAATAEKTYEKSTEVKANDLYNKNSTSALKQAESNKIYDKTDLYHHITKSGGSELYNNPQFDQTSSPQFPLKNKSIRTPTPSIYGTRKQVEVLDQYSNPALLKKENKQYEMMRKLHQMPDMVYEALAVDYNQRNINTYKSTTDRESPYNVPTPDYNQDEDSPYDSYKKYTGNYPHHPKFRYEKYFDQTDERDPYVPTPDYNTYGRSKKLGQKQYQPDSPIYSRKSPHHVIVDYETDSLERMSSGKNRNSFSTSTSSDISSQPSPSLSTALPLEEEVEIRNAVYDRVEGFRKDSDTIKKEREKQKIYDDVDGLKDKKEPKIKYNTPFHGSMTIEVEHNPDECEQSTDSDQFEPDTLDRKPKKNKNLVKNNWSNPNSNSISHQEKNLYSLPDLNHLNTTINKPFILKGSNSFKSENNLYLSNKIIENEIRKAAIESKSNFGSLRNIYESKSFNQSTVLPAVHKTTKIEKADLTEKGKLLSLESRHSKRQRNINEKLMPPDVIPSDKNTKNSITGLYDRPKNAGLIVRSLSSKNLSSWNTDDFNSNGGNKGNNNKYLSKQKIQQLTPPPAPPPLPPTQQQQQQHSHHHHHKQQTPQQYSPADDTYESNSMTSGSTEFTGVSDTQLNSEYEKDQVRNKLNNIHREYSQVNKISKANQEQAVLQHDGFFINEMEGHYGILEHFMTMGEIKNKSYLDHCNNKLYEMNSDGNSNKSDDFYETEKMMGKKDRNDATNQKRVGQKLGSSNTDDDIDKIEVISTKSLSSHYFTVDKSKKIDLSDITAERHSPIIPPITPTKVFRVEINPSTHGMQIALGLKDRVKKSKDLKNAWKRFIGKATSKFNGSTNSSGKTELNSKTDLDNLDKVSLSSDKDEGISSLIDENTKHMLDDQNRHYLHLDKQPRYIATSNSNLSRSNSRLSAKELDSGYMSTDSNESRMHNKKLYERFNFNSSVNRICEAEDSNNDDDDGSNSNYTTGEFKKTASEKSLHEFKSIPEMSEKTKTSSLSSNSTGTKSIYKQRPRLPPPLPPPNPPPQPPVATAKGGIEQDCKSIVSITSSQRLQGENSLKPINVKIYSSEDEHYSSSSLCSETDEESNIDELCESGAESIETHSVFFKNIRKSNS